MARTEDEAQIQQETGKVVGRMDEEEAARGAAPSGTRENNFNTRAVPPPDAESQLVAKQRAKIQQLEQDLGIVNEQWEADRDAKTAAEIEYSVKTAEMDQQTKVVMQLSVIQNCCDFARCKSRTNKIEPCGKPLAPLSIPSPSSKPNLCCYPACLRMDIFL